MLDLNPPPYQYDKIHGRSKSVTDLWKGVHPDHQQEYLANRWRYAYRVPVIQPVVDDYADRAIAACYNWDGQLEKAYKNFLDRPKLLRGWRIWDRPVASPWDKFRWSLHLKLLKWGVII